MTKETFLLVTGLASGLALFLFGMKLLGDGLQKTAGDSLRRILKLLTSNPFNALLVGLTLTSILQSSSATTVMVVGFVNAGLMSLMQAMGVIFGANVGTTITAQIIVFKLDKWVWLFLSVGALIYFFTKKKSYQALGESLLGFGILFFGLYHMSGALAPLRTDQTLINYLVNFGKHPYMGILASAIFTGIIQSSSVTTSLVVALSLQGIIPLPSAIALILGANIGTTVTAVIASAGANVSSKRAALVHFLFNFIGVIIILPFLKPFTELVLMTSDYLPRQVANAHTIFNVSMALFAVLLIKPFEKLVVSLLPTEVEELEERKTVYLDNRILSTPTVALDQATKELVRMGEITYKMVAACQNSFFDNKLNSLTTILEREIVVNILQREITTYLTRITEHDLIEEQSARALALMHAVNDIERIGDHAENIVELIEIKRDQNLIYPEESLRDARATFEQVLKTLKMALDSLQDYDVEKAKNAKVMEKETDKLTRSFVAVNITRLNEKKIKPYSGIILVDLISNLERISDHSENIADVVLGIL